MKFDIARVLSVAALTGTAVAAPEKRSVSSSVLNDLSLYAQWSAAAYCSGNVDGTSNPVTCPAGNCPDVEAANTETLYEFDNVNSYGNAAGFLAVDHTNQLIVLSFRGSRTLSNWIANLNTALSPSSLCSGCEVHDGFWKDYQTVASTLQNKIDSAQQTYPGYALMITGHSLGGALALLCGTDLHNKGYSPKMYTYGQPRVGNLALAQYITQIGGNWRTTHTDDSVPKLPSTIYGYSHSSPEYWITSGNDLPVTTSDIQVIQGVDSTAGNAGTTTSSIASHHWYFRSIDSCA